MNRFKSFIQRYDYTVLFLLDCLMVVSIVAIYTAQPFLQGALSEINFSAKQVQWYVIGFVALSVIILIDYEQLKHFHWYLYGAGNIALTGLVVLRGHLWSLKSKVLMDGISSQLLELSSLPSS